MASLTKMTEFILTTNNIPISFTDIKKLDTDGTSYYETLFKNLNWDNLSLLVSGMTNFSGYVPIIMNNLNYLLLHVDSSVLNKMVIYIKQNGITDDTILNTIKDNSDNIEIYLREIRYIKNRIDEYKKIFEKDNLLLYSLYDKLDTSIYDKNAFENCLIYPQSFFNVNKYLNYILGKLNLNIDDFEYMSSGRGNYGWCFKNSDLVLKLSTSCAVWDIPMHYRINDFIVRKQFGNTVLSIAPYGDTDSVTNQDIKDVLSDFDEAGISLTDRNYKDNFAVVDYEIPKDMFRDVNGIRCIVDTPFSTQYQKKKVKLIDQDFLYLQNDQDKKTGIFGEKWRDK